MSALQVLETKARSDSCFLRGWRMAVLQFLEPDGVTADAGVIPIKWPAK